MDLVLNPSIKMAKKKPRKLNIRQLETALRFFKLKPEDVLPEYAFKDWGEKRYHWIEDFNVEIVYQGEVQEENGNVDVNISGVYVQQMACGKRGAGGVWQPAKPLRKNFEYSLMNFVVN